jgi:hypothetical protein
MEIKTSFIKKSGIAVILLVLIISAGFVINKFVVANPGQSSHLAGSTEGIIMIDTPATGQTSEQAMRAGLKAVCEGMDYSKNKDEWAVNVCSVSDPQGCSLFQNYYIPLFWPTIVKHKIQISCQYGSAAITNELDRPIGKIQIWKTHVIETVLQDGESKNTEQDLYSSTVKNEEGDWTFFRIFTDQKDFEGFLAVGSDN